MSKIGIDVDGVLRDFCESLTNVVKEKYPTYLPDNFQGIKSWYFDGDFNCSIDDLKQIYWYKDAKQIMGDGLPMPGQIKQMYDLFEWGEKNNHTFVCVTSQRAHARHHTLTWLGRYGMEFDTIYFRRGRDKWKVDVDYLVDDSPENFKAWVYGRGMQEGFILRDAPYNQDINASYRIENLKEITDIIK